MSELCLSAEFFPMNERDLDTVSALEASLQAFPWSRGNFADSLASACADTSLNLVCSAVNASACLAASARAAVFSSRVLVNSSFLAWRAAMACNLPSAAARAAQGLSSKVAALGNVSVEPKAMPDTSTLYIVRMGPYTDVEESSRVLAQLNDMGINPKTVTK